MIDIERRIGVVGLGYVGLPVAVSFAENDRVIGYDVDENKIKQLQQQIDPTGQFSPDELKTRAITFTTDADHLQRCTHIIVAVPTPIGSANEPDLSFLKQASKMIGANMAQGTIIVFESTVSPGTTEGTCIPILEKQSGFIAGVDFYVGYSPERINPGDQAHAFKNTPKVIAAQNGEALEKVYDLYHRVVTAPLFKTSSIKIAEAAKIIENTQRDVNIAFMNEISLICDKLNIDTHEVLEAANTKWNFIPLSPGLVGGHCIGVDPYHLIHKSTLEGYDPTLLRKARQINEQIPKYIVESLLKLIVSRGFNPKTMRITILGVAFKENITDTRNSKALEIVDRLKQLDLTIQVHDPHVTCEQIPMLQPFDHLKKAEIVILAVPHDAYDGKRLATLLKDRGVLMDIKDVIPATALPENITKWTL